MIKTKSKNQNYVPNKFFFYNLEFKSGLKFQLQYWKKSRNQNRKWKHVPNRSSVILDSNHSLSYAYQTASKTQ